MISVLLAMCGRERTFVTLGFIGGFGNRMTSLRSCMLFCMIDNAERMGTTSSKAGNKHRPRILHLKQHIPGDLMRSLCEALDNLQRDASTHAGLFSGTRNEIWTDIIDPELCLRVETQSSIAPEPPEEKLNRFRPRSRVRSRPARPPPKKYWQSAEAEADQHGQVRWKSWLNHLSADRHKDLLEKIASLATLALPQLEKVVHPH